MSKRRVGLIGWRGMVGSVLLERMVEEGDFELIDASFFSTSQSGEKISDGPGKGKTLLDAYDLESLSGHDILLSCQGGDYTNKVHHELRKSGWKGYWIDAASSLRMSPESMICLDPLNGKQLEQGLERGVKDFIGGNCTVSLMLMAMGGLFKAGLVEFVSSQTYQAASGGGAQHMRELLFQMRSLTQQLGADLDDPKVGILKLDETLSSILSRAKVPVDHFGYPLAGSLLPWIDVPMESGQSKEEWKAQVEANKILHTSQDNPIPIDGTCVRVGAMRSHSQALMVKLKKSISIHEIEELLREHNSWTKLVANNPEDSKKYLTPAAVSGTMDIAVGRLRKLTMGDQYLNAFTVGDQLLWGAAEPLRRMLGLVLQ